MTMIMPKAAHYNVLDEVGTQLITDGVLKLYKNDVTPDSDTVVGDLEVADFDGYADIPSLIPNEVYTDTDNTVSIGIDSVQFNWAFDSASTANTIYGFYILDANGDLLAVERLASPKNMANANDSVVVSPKINLPNSV